MKVSILNYFDDQDILGFDKNSKFKYRRDAQYSYLEISRIGTTEEYKEAIRNVYNKNTGNVPILQTRILTINITDADFLPETEHFYRFVKKADVTWVEAKEA